MSELKRTEHVPAEASGERLDRALERFLPGTSLRLRRRLIEDGKVLLDGEAKRPGFRLRGGELLEHPVFGEPRTAEAMVPLGARVLVSNDEYAAILKPEGVHSALIAGRDTPSVEAALGLLFPEAAGSQRAPRLVNRLDQPTSGILLVAFGVEAAERYRRLEAEGLVRKTYLARVAGRVEKPLCLRGTLDVDDRRRTRVLTVESPDPTRWTEVEELGHVQGTGAGASEGTSDVLAVIRRGARHQIRAHLATARHPILGDDLYGGPPASRLFLHHLRIEMPDFYAQAPQAWPPFLAAP